MAYEFNVTSNDISPMFIDIEVKNVISVMVNVDDRSMITKQTYPNTFIGFEFPDNKFYLHKIKCFKKLRDHIINDDYTNDFTIYLKHEGDYYRCSHDCKHNIVTYLDKKGKFLYYSTKIILQSCAHTREFKMFSINIEFNKTSLLSMVNEVIKLLDDYMSVAIIKYDSNRIYLHNVAVLSYIFPSNNLPEFLHTIRIGSEYYNNPYAIRISYKKKEQIFLILCTNTILDINIEYKPTYFAIKIPQDQYISWLNEAFKVNISFIENGFMIDNVPYKN